MNDLKQKLLGGGAPQTLPVNIRDIQMAVPPQKGMPNNLPRIMFCIPSGRTWESRTAACVAGLVSYTAMQGYSVGIANLESSMITKGRNDLAAMSIKQGFDYSMWIDTDMVMPPDTVIRLLAHKKDIVGATYNKRVPPYETLGRLKGQKPGDVTTLGGLKEAEQMPGGCMLVKNTVYQKLGWPWYWETYRWPGENGVDQLKNYLRHNYSVHAPEELLAKLDEIPIADWLNKTYTEEAKFNWEYYSEDLNFVRKAIKAGYRVWCDLDLTFQMVHLGTLEITCKKPEDALPSPIVDAQM